MVPHTNTYIQTPLVFHLLTWGSLRLVPTSPNQQTHSCFHLFCSFYLAYLFIFELHLLLNGCINFTRTVVSNHALLNIADYKQLVISSIFEERAWGRDQIISSYWVQNSFRQCKPLANCSYKTIVYCKFHLFKHPIVQCILLVSFLFSSTIDCFCTHRTASLVHRLPMFSQPSSQASPVFVFWFVFSTIYGCGSVTKNGEGLGTLIV